MFQLSDIIQLPGFRLRGPGSGSLSERTENPPSAFFSFSGTMNQPAGIFVRGECECTRRRTSGQFSKSGAVADCVCAEILLNNESDFAETCRLARSLAKCVVAGRGHPPIGSLFRDGLFTCQAQEMQRAEGSRWWLLEVGCWKLVVGSWLLEVWSRRSQGPSLALGAGSG